MSPPGKSKLSKNRAIFGAAVTTAFVCVMDKARSVVVRNWKLESKDSDFRLLSLKKAK